jgi:hypothetical protein
MRKIMETIVRISGASPKFEPRTNVTAKPNESEL